MTYSDFRRIARENLTNNWALSIGVSVVACLLGGLIVGSNFLPEVEYRIEDQNISNLSDLFRIVLASGGIAVRLTSLLGLAQFIIGGVIELGYTQYLLKQYNRANFEFNDLFSQFERFGQGFAQAFLRGLYTFLWTLLLVVPGIIAAYSYAMTPFIMAENPDMTASEAIAASKELMNGHKFDLFVLGLTFIGWDLLAVLTLNLGHIALNPYKNAAYAAFYKNLTAPRAQF